MADLMDAEVLGMESPAPGCFEVLFSAPEVAGRARPGQFLHVLCGDGPGGDGLRRYLRRPFSLFRIDRRAGMVAVLFRVIGEGTRWLSGRRPGDRVSVIGPLGNGFPLPASAGGSSAGGFTPLVVGGGIGIPPLLPLAQELSRSGLKPVVLLGARTAGELFAEDDFRAAGCQVEIVTDDGSRGVKASVTVLLEEALARSRPAGDGAAVYACGPRPMLQAVQAMAARYLVPAFLSVEERMACGVGACLGCPVAVTGPGAHCLLPGSALELPDREALVAGYRRVGLAVGAGAGGAGAGVSFVRACREGPVFPAWGVVI